MDTTILALLKQHGFKWYKDHCTDSVTADSIQAIFPAANGFTVVYTQDCALRFSTAVVERIEMPRNFETTWIFVHWKSVEDERRDAASVEIIPTQHEPKVA